MAIPRPLPLWKGQGQESEETEWRRRSVYTGGVWMWREVKGDQKPIEDLERMGRRCFLKEVLGELTVGRTRRRNVGKSVTEGDELPVRKWFAFKAAVCSQVCLGLGHFRKQTSHVRVGNPRVGPSSIVSSLWHSIILYAHEKQFLPPVWVSLHILTAAAFEADRAWSAWSRVKIARGKGWGQGQTKWRSCWHDSRKHRGKGFILLYFFIFLQSFIYLKKQKQKKSKPGSVGTIMVLKFPVVSSITLPDFTRFTPLH